MPIAVIDFLESVNIRHEQIEWFLICIRDMIVNPCKASRMIVQLCQCIGIDLPALKTREDHEHAEGEEQQGKWNISGQDLENSSGNKQKGELQIETPFLTVDRAVFHTF